MPDKTATLKYDFFSGQWQAVADWRLGLAGYGDTPEEAVKGLAHQCDKLGLWPKEN